MPGTGTYLTLWSSLVAIYLIAPCLFSRNQRQRWYLRFTLRRWHVEHLLTMHTSQSLLPDEEEERLRNEFLAKKLENFTMVRQEIDVVHTCGSKKPPAGSLNRYFTQ